MDPNATLADIRQAINTLNDHEDRDVAALVSAVDALDSWLSGGGFLPNDWQPRAGR